MISVKSKLPTFIALFGLLFAPISYAAPEVEKVPNENKVLESEKPTPIEAIEAIVEPEKNDDKVDEGDPVKPVNDQVVGEVQNPGPDNENPGQGQVVSQENNGSENGNGVTEINLCHATGSESNPWEFITVDDDATKGGHANHEGYIIPIGDVNNDGQINVVDCEEEGGNGNGEVCPLIESTVNLVAPVNSASGLSTTVTFDWDAVTDAEQYKLIVATDPMFANAVVNETNLTATEFTANLASGTTFYWMVTAVSTDEENECAVNSEVRSFTTASATVVTPDTNGGIGGGVVVLPTPTTVTDGIGGGVVSDGVGGGAFEEGIGGGTLPETGMEGLVAPLILSSIVTFFMALKRKRYLSL